MGSVTTAARRFLVAGRVQGVGFRYFILRAASEIGVNGWVRNLSDGSVEVHAQGEVALLDDLASRLRAGPPHAVVRSVEMREAAVERLNCFRIRD